MKATSNLPTDFLRSFVMGVDLGSFARAAERLGRTASTLSLQLDRLEQIVGQPLLVRQGRGLVLTEAGEALLPYARRMVDLNDEALARLAPLGPVEGWLRLGLAEDLAEGWLPGFLGRFRRINPKLRLELHSGRGAALRAALDASDLDLVILWSDTAEGDVLLSTAPCWVGPAGFSRAPGTPVPLLAMSPPCPFRARAVAALEGAACDWQLVFSSHSLSGIWAAARSGLGVTLRTRFGLPDGVVVLDHTSGLPAPPGQPLSLCLHHASRTPSRAAARLQALILDELALAGGAVRPADPSKVSPSARTDPPPAA